MEIDKRKAKAKSRDRGIVPGRYRLLYIDKGQVFDSVTTMWEYDMIQLPDYTGLLPKDYEVRDVFYEPSRNAFGFIIASKEFEAVKPGHSIPIIITTLQKKRVISLADPKIRQLLGLGR